VLEAATRTIDRDSQLLSWNEEMGRIKSMFLESRRGIKRERKLMKREERDQKRERKARVDEGGGADA
jgi:hypothetical protein